jgi:predicted Rossmann-fold nucleotide-binding protein
MGDGRNFLNVMSSDVVVALPGRAGTISEIALALKNGKIVILLKFPIGDFFIEHKQAKMLIPLEEPEEVIEEIKNIFGFEME